MRASLGVMPVTPFQATRSAKMEPTFGTDYKGPDVWRQVPLEEGDATRLRVFALTTDDRGEQFGGSPVMAFYGVNEHGKIDCFLAPDCVVDGAFRPTAEPLGLWELRLPEARAGIAEAPEPRCDAMTTPPGEQEVIRCRRYVGHEADHSDGGFSWSNDG